MAAANSYNLGHRVQLLLGGSMKASVDTCSSCATLRVRFLGLYGGAPNLRASTVLSLEDNIIAFWETNW